MKAKRKPIMGDYYCECEKCICTGGLNWKHVCIGPTPITHDANWQRTPRKKRKEKKR